MNSLSMNIGHLQRLVVLSLYFTLLWFYFSVYAPGYFIWLILITSALVWFLFEYYKNKYDVIILRNAIVLGLFLMIFNFIVENIGAYFNFWRVGMTVFHVMEVPIEVMFICLFGGAAWALAQPKKFNPISTVTNILLFSTFGMIGEGTLIHNEIMYYANGWTSFHAFGGYAIAWIILFYVWYKLLPQNKKI